MIIKGKVVYKSDTIYYQKFDGPPPSLKEGDVVKVGDKIVEGTTVHFDATVKAVGKSRIVYKLPAVVINLFNSKGDSIVGNLRYVKSSDFSDKKSISKDLEGKVAIIDNLTKELYPMLSTLGVVGIITNGLDYHLFDDIILLAVPVGIISGYGELKEDSEILAYIEKNEGKNVWFDAKYSRLVIPEMKEPIWLKKYQYDLKKIGIV